MEKALELNNNAGAAGFLPQVIELLEEGANPNMPIGLNSRTAVHNAAASFASEGPQHVRVLIDHGGDPSARDGDGNTPLHLVAGFAIGTGG